VGGAQQKNTQITAIDNAADRSLGNGGEIIIDFKTKLRFMLCAFEKRQRQD
jgi:hypothetical protein